MVIMLIIFLLFILLGLIKIFVNLFGSNAHLRSLKYDILECSVNYDIYGFLLSYLLSLAHSLTYRYAHFD